MNSLDPYLLAVPAPLMLVLVAVICLLAWRLTPARRTYLLWDAANLWLIACVLSLQILQSDQDPYINQYWVAALYLSSAFCLAQSVVRRFAQVLDARLAVCATALTFVGLWYFAEVQVSSAGRITVLSLGMASMMFLALAKLKGYALRHYLDRISFSLAWLIAIVTLARLCFLLLQGDEPVTVGATTKHTLVWWFAIFTWLLLYIPYSISLVACAIHESFSVLQNQSNTDSLTSLLNRRAFAEVCTSLPYEDGFRVLVLCDLDYFKSINDTHGHTVGDEVLCQFAFLLRTNLRNIDVVARWGGEEFAIAMRKTNLSDAISAVQRISHLMSNTRWGVDAKKAIMITASYGLIQLLPHETVQEALQRADALLYSAKDAGRNCICWESENGRGSLTPKLSSIA